LVRCEFVDRAPAPASAATRFVDGHYGLAFLIEHVPAGVDRGHDDVVVWSADAAHDVRLQSDIRGSTPTMGGKKISRFPRRESAI
jgi:hypothetical protein